MFARSASARRSRTRALPLLRGPFSAFTANLVALLLTAVANTAANRRLTFGVAAPAGSLAIIPRADRLRVRARRHQRHPVAAARLRGAHPAREVVALTAANLRRHGDAVRGDARLGVRPTRGCQPTIRRQSPASGRYPTGRGGCGPGAAAGVVGGCSEDQELEGVVALLERQQATGAVLQPPAAQAEVPGAGTSPRGESRGSSRTDLAGVRATQDVVPGGVGAHTHSSVGC